MGDAYSCLGQTKVLHAISFVLLVAKRISCEGNNASELIWSIFQKCVDPNPYYQRWLYRGGHLLGKGWPLGSLVCDVFLCYCHFPM